MRKGPEEKGEKGRPAEEKLSLHASHLCSGGGGFCVAVGKNWKGGGTIPDRIENERR